MKLKIGAQVALVKKIDKTNMNGMCCVVVKWFTRIFLKNVANPGKDHDEMLTPEEMDEINDLWNMRKGKPNNRITLW